MIKKLAGERWKEASFHKSLTKKYAVSNKGRVASFTHDLIEDGTLLKGSLQQGYKIIRFRVRAKNGIRYEFIFFHTLVAQYFCKQKSAEHSKIIFKDYNRKNIASDNLSWVTVRQQFEHSMKSPNYKKALKKRRELGIGAVLNIEKVKKIKQALKEGSTLKKLATKYKVSDMQIHRIKTGENWGYVKA
jgi:hypothetical protein